MTQYSWCWECIGIGDGDARTVNDIIAQNMFLGNLNPDTAGVVDWTDGNAIPGITNPPTGGLAPTNPSGDTVRIATGVGLVQGWIYVNDANVDFDVSGGNASATDIIVLRRGDPATVGTVRLAHKRGPGGGTATVTQSATTWEVKIAEVTLDGSGDFSSLSDVREYVETPLKVNTASLVDNAVTAAKIPNESITTSKIQNRTRTIFVPVIMGVEAVSGAVIDPTPSTIGRGLPMPDGVESFAIGFFQVPQDFVSGMSAQPVVVSGGTGDFYGRLEVQYGAGGESFATHDESLGLPEAAEAVTDGIIHMMSGTSFDISLGDASIGDNVKCGLTRSADDANDTVGDYVAIRGFLVTYTADS